MGTDVQIILVAALVGAAIFAAAYALFGSSIKQKEGAQKRMQAVARTGAREAAEDNRRGDPEAKRRKAVQQQLKELEKQQKAKRKSVSMRMKIERAGLSISPLMLHVLGGLFGLAVAGFLIFAEYPPIVGLCGGLALGLGFPRWLLSFLAKRRIKKFSTEFVNAIDIIVRGIRSGLPVNECLGIIARECRAPVSDEFQTIVAGQKVGVTVEQSLERMLERIPTSELNFFAIVLAIQQKTGGNLAEALSNLSNVLRERKKMKGKIGAMSSEAKSSAMIIGSLPFMVMALIHLATPDYLTPLFTERMGNMLLLGGAMWMSMGVIVMRKMINFDF
ncbi:MAG: type II secretion system F family protein [Alphaproteobacteria bacterium]|nr:type II secretion system F family protein [Alphaproteobacteria bacterium]MDX5369846.1 type II secretion system F family protein [Alphaproteobacteria bacterium]MDX5464462.1 type II secretion system F family protein [Alphaproteobacteria bacterium]